MGNCKEEKIKEMIKEEGGIVTKVGDSGEWEWSRAPDLGSLASADSVSTVLTPGDSMSSGLVTGSGIDCSWITPGVLKTDWATMPVGAVEVVKTEPPVYAESFLPHLVRAKEEGSRRGIEMDTVVIDRGVAVSCGVDHADVILGLRVKYAKEGSLPMDSAFIILKGKDKEKRRDDDKSPRESASASMDASATGVIPGERVVDTTFDARHRKFLCYTDKDSGHHALVNINRVVEAKDRFSDEGGTWSGLELSVDDGYAEGVKKILITDEKEAAAAWKQIMRAEVHD